MNVVIDARYLNAARSGIATYTENLVDQLLKVESENRYGLVTRWPGLAERFDPRRCYDIVFNARPASYKTTVFLGRVLNRMAFDIYHSPFNFLPSGLERPSVVTIHDVIPLMDPRLIDKRLIFRLSAGRFWRNSLTHAVRTASIPVTISSASARGIEEHFGPEVGARTMVTGMGLDPLFLEGAEDDQVCIEDLVGGSFPYILSVGQGSPRKNHVRAIQAFDKAFSPDDAMRYILVRRLKRRDREFDRLLSEPSIRNRVIVLTYVTSDELKALYRNARAVFLPSLVEGFGLPIIEAMASRSPVVTSNIGAMAEVAGEAAWMCSPYDISAMASALIDATTDGNERARIINLGAERARSFNFRNCAVRTLDVYRQLGL